jgi:hypothetical protein
MQDVETGNFLKKIFFFAFMKWVLVNRPDCWVQDFAMKRTNQEFGLSEIELIEKRLKDMVHQLETGSYDYSNTLCLFAPWVFNALGENSKFKYNKFIIRMSFNIDDDELHSRQRVERPIAVSIQNQSDDDRPDVKKLKNYMFALTNQVIFDKYNDKLEYLFEEKLFEDLYQLMEQVSVVNLRYFVINYQ